MHIFEPHEIDLTSPDSFGQARSAAAADFDGDGDLDVVSVSRKEGTLAWHENMDGHGKFHSQPALISTEASGADFVLAADIDQDGDSDVLYVSSAENQIAWHENLGDGSFSDSKLISADADSPRNVAVADLDSDGDLDLISASSDDDSIAWYENTDVTGTFKPGQVITDQADGAAWVFAADIDGDGDSDVLVASANDDVLAWYGNQDGQGTFGDRILISNPNPTDSRSYFVSAADLDGDGDLDVISASDIDDEVSWYENSDGQGRFGPEQVIMQNLARRIFSPRIDSVYAADVDSDGDLDVISADEFGHETYWSENTNGLGEFGPQQPIGPMSELTGGSIQIADIDNDGDPDILAASDHEGIIAWHENRLIGDADDNGVFDTSDLVLVFQAGEYLDDQQGNSTFDTGDWNLDGDFNSSDLVLAFQAGSFSASEPQATI